MPVFKQCLVVSKYKNMSAILQDKSQSSHLCPWWALVRPHTACCRSFLEGRWCCLLPKTVTQDAGWGPVGQFLYLKGKSILCHPR